MKSSYFLGVDGGGTKTLALIASQEGRILGWGKGGPSNPNFVSSKIAFQSIQQAVQQALTCCEKSQLQHVAFCVPALRHYINIEDLIQLVSLPVKNISIAADDISTFYGALGKETGVVVLAGTGSFALGMDSRGKVVRIGGWGPLLGDEGSGYFIGQAALRAVIAEHERGGPTTILTILVKNYFGIVDFYDLRHRIYQQSSYQREISSLTPLVLQAAQSGDLVAGAILCQAGTMLGEMAVFVIQHINFDSQIDTVILAGGVSNLGKWIWTPFCQEVQKVSNLIQPQTAHFVPAVGALIVAFKDSGQALHPQLLKNLRKSYLAMKEKGIEE